MCQSGQVVSLAIYTRCEPCAETDPLGIAGGGVPLLAVKIGQYLLGHCFKHVTSPMRIEPRLLANHGENRSDRFSGVAIKCHAHYPQA